MAKTPDQFISDLAELTDAEVRADFLTLFSNALSIEEAEQQQREQQQDTSSDADGISQ